MSGGRTVTADRSPSSKQAPHSRAKRGLLVLRVLGRLRLDARVDPARLRGQRLDGGIKLGNLAWGWEQVKFRADARKTWNSSRFLIFNRKIQRRLGFPIQPLLRNESTSKR